MDLLPTVSECTLPTVDQPLRVREFANLLTTVLTDLDRVDDTTLDLWLRDEPGLEDSVEALTARESACCSFFTFALDRADGLTLRVQVPAAYVDVLDGLERLAEAAARSATR